MKSQFYSIFAVLFRQGLFFAINYLVEKQPLTKDFYGRKLCDEVCILLIKIFNKICNEIRTYWKSFCLSFTLLGKNF